LRQIASLWIQARQIRSLTPVAPMAGESEVLKRVVAPMLAGDDVLHVEGYRCLVVATESAILASMPRAFKDDPAQSRVHQDALLRVSQTRALAWRIETISTACT
jgi:hypothetical protein